MDGTLGAIMGAVGGKHPNYPFNEEMVDVATRMGAGWDPLPVAGQAANSHPGPFVEGDGRNLSQLADPKAPGFKMFNDIFEGTPGDPPAFSEYNLNYNPYHQMFHSEDRRYPTHGQFRELMERMRRGD